MAKKSRPKKAKSKPRRKPSSVVQLTPAKVLEHLVELSMTQTARARSATGEIGQAIKDAVEHKHLNARAFRMVNTFWKMGVADPLKLRMTIEAFDDYRAKLKLDDIKAPDILKPEKRKKASKPKKEPKSATVLSIVPKGDQPMEMQAAE